MPGRGWNAPSPEPPLDTGAGLPHLGRMTIAIIGAGLAGLSCARALRDAGRAVRLYDKGRAAGGRMASKRLDVAGGTIRIDHGAQYLTARDAGFAALLAASGAQPWPDAQRFVPVPAMTALPRAMAEGLALDTGRHVVALESTQGGWLLHHLPAEKLRPGKPLPEMEPNVDGPFAAVVVTAPAPQAAELLAPVAPAMAELLDGVVYAPCWTWLAAFAHPLDLPDVLRPESGPIGWAARNNAKPGRDAMEAWVVQAGPEWSRAHLEDDAAAVAAALRAALGAPPPLAEATHRWRYSLVEQALDRPCVWDRGRALGLAGDFCLAGRAEAAWLSGQAMAEAILA